MINIIWLVVWNMNLIFFPFIYGNVIIPTDFRIFFRGIETTNQQDIAKLSMGEKSGTMNKNP